VHITPQLSASEGGRILTEVRITGTNTGEIALGDFGRATAEIGEEGLVVAERQNLCACVQGLLTGTRDEVFSEVRCRSTFS
jgi:hypothetical protein